MSSGHVIHAQDWPEVSQLIQRERSGQFGKRPSETQQAPSQDSRSVILLEGLGPGGVTRGQVVRSSGKFVQDVFSPDEVVKRVRLGIGREGFEPEEFSQEINLNESTPEEILRALSGTSVDQYVETVEKAGRRIKFLFKDSAPGFRFVNDPDQPRLFVNQSSVRLSTEIVYLYAGPSVSDFLLPGTFCQVDHVAGKGLTVIDFERYSEPVNSEPQVIFRDGDVSGCTRQIIPQGDSSECDACGENDTPDAFSINANTTYWPILEKLIKPSIDVLSYDGRAFTLLHDSGCVYKSDFFDTEDSLYWEATLFRNANSPTSCRVRLMGASNSFYAEGLEIVYWSERPFDALSVNKLIRVTHDSKGTPDLPRHASPGCITMRPWTEPCYNKGGDEDYGFNIQPFNCVSYWSTRFIGNELVSGPRRPDTDLESDPFVIGCVWDAYPAGEDPSMVVKYFRTTGGMGSAKLRTRFGWSFVAVIKYYGSEFTYQKTVNERNGDPNCFDHRLYLQRNLSLNTPEALDSVPQSILLNSWQK